MAKLNPVSQQQFQVTISDPGGGESLSDLYFNKMSAPQESRSEQDYSDGVTGQVYKHMGFISNENVTLTKIFDPVKDLALTRWYEERRNSKGQPFTISATPVKADRLGSPIDGARTVTLSGCQLVSFTYPGVDREATGIATLQMVVYPESTSYN